MITVVESSLWTVISEFCVSDIIFIIRSQLQNPNVQSDLNDSIILFCSHLDMDQ